MIKHVYPTQNDLMFELIINLTGDTGGNTRKRVYSTSCGCKFVAEYEASTVDDSPSRWELIHYSCKSPAFPSTLEKVEASDQIKYRVQKAIEDTKHAEITHIGVHTEEGKKCISLMEAIENGSADDRRQMGQDLVEADGQNYRIGYRLSSLSGIRSANKAFKKAAEISADISKPLIIID